jgi:hypothetical protein
MLEGEERLVAQNQHEAREKKHARIAKIAQMYSKSQRKTIYSPPLHPADMQMTNAPRQES